MGECVACRTLDRVRALTRIVAPLDPIVVDLTAAAGSTILAGGPGCLFGVGVLLRISAGPGGVYWRPVKGSSPDLTRYDETNMIYLGPGSWVDIEVTRELAIIVRPEPAPSVPPGANVTLWPTDILRMDPSDLSSVPSGA